MKVIEPVSGNIIFGPVVIVDKKVYHIPRDLDWLVCRVSDKGTKFSLWMWSVMVIACILMPPFIILFALAYVSWRISGGDKVATVELRFKDGLYIRGVTTDKEEMEFAQQNQFGEIPPQTQRQHFPKAPLLKVVKANHHAP